MKKFLVLSTLFLFVFASYAQEKKPLTYDDILKWNRITQRLISNDGNYIAYKAEPWKGDAVLKIIDKHGAEQSSIIGGNNAIISNNSRYVAFTIQPEEDQVRKLKLKKTDKDEMPLNKLGIYNIKTKELDTVKNLKSFKLPKQWDGFIAYQTKTELVKDTLRNDDEKVKKESKENGYMLNIRHLLSGEVIQIPYVTDYTFAKNKEVIAFVSTGNDNDVEPGVYYYNLLDADKTAVLPGKGTYKQLTINRTGSRLAFLADTTNNKKPAYHLYLWDQNDGLKDLASTHTIGIEEGWEISENGTLKIADKTQRLYFGIAPVKPEKDTTKLDEEIPELDVWHWNEPILHTEQLNTKKDDLKKSYLAVYHLENNKIVQLGRKSYSDIELINEGNADYMLAYSNLPYAVQRMWEGYPEHNDFYLININTGDREMFKQNVRAYPNASPNGKYIYWYNAMDTTWNTFNISKRKAYKISTPGVIQCADEINDIPNPASSYGTGGWLKNDEALLLYDRFDIWKVDPENKAEPLNITVDGRRSGTRYRLIDYDKDYYGFIKEEYKGVDVSKGLYLIGHNEVSREDGFYKIDIHNKKSPKVLLRGKFRLSAPIRAKDANVLVYTKEDFQEYPNLSVTENDYKKSHIVSDVNPQQKEFLWGTKELYTWTSLDGQKLEGLLVKPANFDPDKKYPLIVNFYEKSSQRLYDHQIPEAHRSTIDYHYYASHDYVIFNPDVYYKEGYPGESAFNCVMPGISKLISEGFIDEKAIAAQGHSWGGYQVAYLATRTNMFAAIESGAPVVNMFSAYGGIRLWTGRNRSFQYEHTQSRIGKSIWESPLRYLENSPLFTVDKITTPMLIMHNEDYGAVPFSQGVEFFIALRRLKKQAWLLNYNDADHWPTLVRDKYDFQIRLAQFFDHYLKGEPMPKWMEEGIPAVDKGFDLGY
ncbi:alpha/beta hydrolase family protein [Carboxylicivirga sp. RSCT41]|uniref:alpha/beta hydrolase family protein n=1 Tax=Carboxylicivirga agarovorans TaxID=3417570 RepID=UPI003D33ED4F